MKLVKSNLVLLAWGLISWTVLESGYAVMNEGGRAQSNVHDALMAEMEAVFSEIPRMIEHTKNVHKYAVEIQQSEGGDQEVVRAAAILHDIGIPKARERHGSSAGKYQEIEGPPIARKILSKLKMDSERIDHICGIIANHHSDKDPEIVNTIEFMIIWDADWMINLPGRARNKSRDEVALMIEETFKTKKGKLIAKEKFLK
jgi:putative nucleotidyltransferase with HDIG domain